MNILVTGGAGFIGSRLVKALLTEGHQVRILDTFENHGDVTNPIDCLSGCDGADVVYHLAALKSVPESLEKPLLYNKVNIDGTVKILLAAQAAKVSKVIFASSAAVYGAHDSNANILETVKAQPISSYGVTKLAGEQYCRTYAYHSETRCVALRFFNVYGPGQDPNDGYAGVISKFINAMVNGQRPKVFGDGKQIRDFIYIDDVISALVAAKESRNIRNFEEFNIGSGKGQNLLELIKTINQQLGQNIKPELLPAQEGDIRSSVAEIHKAEMYLGWKPKTTFSEGIANTIKHFQGYEVYRDNR